MKKWFLILIILISNLYSYNRFIYFSIGEVSSSIPELNLKNGKGLFFNYVNGNNYFMLKNEFDFIKYSNNIDYMQYKIALGPKLMLRNNYTIYSLLNVFKSSLTGYTAAGGYGLNIGFIILEENRLIFDFDFNINKIYIDTKWYNMYNGKFSIGYYFY